MAQGNGFVSSKMFHANLFLTYCTMVVFGPELINPAPVSACVGKKEKQPRVR